MKAMAYIETANGIRKREFTVPTATNGFVHDAFCKMITVNCVNAVLELEKLYGTTGKPYVHIKSHSPVWDMSVDEIEEILTLKNKTMAYYKILKGTDLFNKLTDFKKRGDKAREAANKLAKELGSDHDAYTSSGDLGGIDALHFEEKPEGWRVVGNRWQSLYYPKADQKELHKKIAALPIVKRSELNDIVGFSGLQMVGMAIIKSVGMAWHNDYCVMEVAAGCKYTPPKDATEILHSEYEKLKSKCK